MNKFSLKSSNLLIFIITLCLFFVLKSYDSFSTSLIDTLPVSNNKTLLQEMQKQYQSSLLMVAFQMDENSAIKTFDKLSNELLPIPHIQKSDLKENRLFLEHQQEYFYQIYHLNEQKAKEIDVVTTLENLYKKLTNSFFPVLIDKQDPLNIFTKYGNSQKVSIKNGLIPINDRLFIGFFELHTKSMDEHEKLYDTLNTVTKNYKNIEIFSSVFYYVENSRIIKNDVNKIIMISMVLLLLLYSLLVRNMVLLLNTICTLATSSLMAFIVLSFFYEHISVFVIAFGISISTVAIDYMFHHYMHDYYHQKKQFNKEVWYGFITTVVAFTLFVFCSFTLIQQIALFTVISLCISYFHFAFLYPQIGFVKSRVIVLQIKKITVSNKLIFFGSLLTIIGCIGFIKMDYNIKNLDVNNTHLQKKEQFFEKAIFHNKQVSVALEAQSIEQLISRAKQLQTLLPNVYIPLSKLVETSEKIDDNLLNQLNKQLNREALKIGFKKDFFADSYKINQKEIVYTPNNLQSFGIKIIQANHKYYYTIMMSQKEYEQIASLEYIQNLSIKKLFENSLKEVYVQFIVLSLAVILIIVLSIVRFIKNNRIYALNFLILPLAIITVFGLFNGLNILNLFMVCILLSIAIDYAFYTAKNNSQETNTAIIYSLVSTFAGFGVLSFSSISALYSLGYVAILGIIAILIMLFVSKGLKNGI